MTKEDRQLLFKDLSARLPYHIRVKVWLKDGTTEEGPLDLGHNYGDVLRDAFYYYDKIIDIKPYLRPMSSMTEEEKEYIKNRWCCEDWYDISDLFNNYKIGFDDVRDFIDWLLSHHFDYRGLIEKGLALEAPEGMYKKGE